MKVSSRDSYNDVIEQLIEDAQELSDQAIKDLEEAIDDQKNGRGLSHEDVGRRMGF